MKQFSSGDPVKNTLGVTGHVLRSVGSGNLYQVKWESGSITTIRGAELELTTALKKVLKKYRLKK